MPDNCLYWYGNTCDWLTGGWTKDGYYYISGTNTHGLDFMTNYIALNASSAYGDAVQLSGIANTIDMTNVSKVSCIATRAATPTTYMNMEFNNSYTSNQYLSLGVEWANSTYWNNYIFCSPTKDVHNISYFAWTDPNGDGYGAAINVYAMLLE